MIGLVFVYSFHLFWSVKSGLKTGIIVGSPVKRLLEDSGSEMIELRGLIINVTLDLSQILILSKDLRNRPICYKKTFQNTKILPT